VTPVARLLLVVPLLVCAACSERSPADPDNATQVASGKVIYAAECALCHAADLEGQPNWKSRKPNGRMPAPPHDDTGHTWHHPDDVLFGITKFGMRPPYGPPGYQSDMPAFRGSLSDQQIWDVVAYIKSRWSPRMREAQAAIEKQYRK
jgi:mono/diheme cytochrome c family protein